MAGGRDEADSVYLSKVSRGREGEQGETERRRELLNSGLMGRAVGAVGAVLDRRRGEEGVGGVVWWESRMTATSDLLSSASQQAGVPFGVWRHHEVCLDEGLRGA